MFEGTEYYEDIEILYEETIYGDKNTLHYVEQSYLTFRGFYRWSRQIRGYLEIH